MASLQLLPSLVESHLLFSLPLMTWYPVVDKRTSFLSSFFCCMKTSREGVTVVLLDMKAKIYLCVSNRTVSDLLFLASGGPLRVQVARPACQQLVVPVR